ncbi:MAG: hypothetical protein NTV21_09425 [Planctomycetota bacterium]|nr:hypothetical protein [Planctomycetota bacterium]
MPKLIEGRRCPHCDVALPTPPPRMCPGCGGSLQQRYLRVGCLSSAPKLVLAAAGAWWLLQRLAETFTA